MSLIQKRSDCLIALPTSLNQRLVAASSTLRACANFLRPLLLSALKRNLLRIVNRSDHRMTAGEFHTRMLSLLRREPFAPSRSNCSTDNDFWYSKPRRLLQTAERLSSGKKIVRIPSSSTGSTLAVSAAMSSRPRRDRSASPGAYRVGTRWYAIRDAVRNGTIPCSRDAESHGSGARGPHAPLPWDSASRLHKVDLCYLPHVEYTSGQDAELYERLTGVAKRLASIWTWARK